MRTAGLFVAAVLAAAPAGCAATGDAGPTTTTEPTPGASASAGLGSPDTTHTGTRATPPPAGGPSLPAARSPKPGGTSVTPPAADGDRRGDLVRGVRTLRGVIERSGDWVLLRDRRATRWALLGTRAQTLQRGVTVEVRGTTAAAPAGCPVKRAIAVTQVL